MVKFGQVVRSAKILPDPLLEPSAAFALSDVDEIMQNQFAIVPGINANNESMTARSYPGRLTFYVARPARSILTWSALPGDISSSNEWRRRLPCNWDRLLRSRRFRPESRRLCVSRRVQARRMSI